MYKKSLCIILVILFCGSYFVVAQKQDKKTEQVSQPSAYSKKLDTVEKKISYATGYDFGKALDERYKKYDIESLLQGLKDAISGTTPALNETERLDSLFKLAEEIKKFRELKMKEVADKNEKKGKAFMEENAKKPGIVATTSGLQYKVIKEGDGPTAKETDRVVVNYKGTLLDGTTFEDTFINANTKGFTLSTTIPGWKEGIQLMKVGSRYQFFLPSKLAYGDKEAGPFITPNSYLIYEIELIAIQQEPQRQ